MKSEIKIFEFFFTFFFNIIALDHNQPPHRISSTCRMLGVKSQNISNLKSFVLSLEAESSGKQSELQQVVGSKYHDFIQSGHHIESMHEYSKSIEKSVLQFDSHSRSLLEATKKIVQYSPHEDDQTSHRIGSGTLLFAFLMNCSFYESQAYNYIIY